MPLKSFGQAKSRLSPVLGPERRSELARTMASRVIAAAGGHTVLVVCDDDQVSSFASDSGAGVVLTPGLGLNAALRRATDEASELGHDRVVIAAGDLPFAHDLGSLWTMAGGRGGDEDVLIVPDRHLRGTNVLSFAVSARPELCFGPDSYHLHLQAAEAAGLEVLVVSDERLGWDVDTPEDLSPPAHLGEFPPARPARHSRGALPHDPLPGSRAG